MILMRHDVNQATILLTTTLLLTQLLSCSHSAVPSSTASNESSVTIRHNSGDWPWWRGPTHDGKNSETNPPSQWDTEKNVVWKSPVPGRGHSSPTLSRDRLYLTTADEEQETQSLLCFSRGSGEQLWSETIHEGGFDRTHKKNSQASATPACDGERVFVAFVNRRALMVTAVDHDGKRAWQNSAGAFTSEHGFGASPVLYKSTVIVSGDSLGDSFLAALYRQSGEIAWRVPRPKGDTHGNYATPIVGTVARRDQLLVAGRHRIDSYDPNTGEQLWYVTGRISEVVANTVTFSGDHVFASGGYPEKELLCIRADGHGDVSDSKVVWSESQAITYVPSPVAHNGRLYVVNDKGIASCYDSKSGTVIWRERIDGNFTASPTLVGGLLYCPNEDGKTYILKASDQYEVIGSNDLGVGIFASPVISNGHIYLRTHDQLYCVGRG